MYTLVAGGVTRDQDGALIPADLANTDWQAYQAWLKAGNTPSPALVAPVPARTTTVSALLDCLSVVQRAAITVDHMQRLLARAAKGRVGLDDPKVVRAAADLAMTPDAWFTLAGA